MCTSEVMERLQNQKQNLKMKQYFAGFQSSCWSTAVICSRNDINSFEQFEVYGDFCAVKQRGQNYNNQSKM